MPSDKKPPKLLFIAPFPPPHAGPEMVSKMLTESALREEYEIIPLNTNFRKSNADKGKKNLALVWAFFRFVFTLNYMLLKHRPALAYYSVTATQLGWIGRDAWCVLFCRMWRVKTVIHMQGSHFRLNYEGFHPLAKLIVRKTCRQVSAAIVQAERLKKQFDGLIEKDDIHYLYQGIDTAKYDNPDRTAYQPGRILFLGHLSEAKGYIDVLQSMEQVVAQCPHARFFFGGTLIRNENNVHFNEYDGTPLPKNDPVAIRQTILSGTCSAHYHELGMVTGKELLDHMLSADIFMLPSYSEGFSVALLEAMSMGKPIIYTPVGAHREIMKDGINGLMSLPGDVNQLTANILRLLQDRSLRDTIAENNYRYARERFDASIIAKDLTAILNKSMDK